MAEKQFDMERFFKALADTTRLRILNMMRGAEVCVCFFVEIIGPNQPKISRHLAYLRQAGLVNTRRDGKWVHYSIAQPADRYAAETLRNTLEWLANDPAMQWDRERLTNVCCAPTLPVQLQGAPLPVTIQLP